MTGVVSDVKTKYSNAGMPLDPALAEVLRKWWDDALQESRELVFASGATPFIRVRTLLCRSRTLRGI